MCGSRYVRRKSHSNFCDGYVGKKDHLKFAILVDDISFVGVDKYEELVIRLSEGR